MDTHGSIGTIQRLIGFLAKHHDIASAGFDYALLVFAGDSGISQENISSYCPFSSWRIVQNHLEGQAFTSIMLDRIGKEEILIDVGLYNDICSSKLIKLKVARGTRNFRYETALDLLEIERAIEVGERMVASLANKGITVIGLAEIGVANTIGAYAALAVLLNLPPLMVVGRGSDSTGDLWPRRLKIVQEVVERINVLPKEALRVVQEVGSLEIAALIGAVLEATRRGVIVVLDGMITGLAALIASRIDSRCKNNLLASIRTMEPGQMYVLKELNLTPIIDLGINYGEGLGAAWGLFLLEIAYRFKIRQDSSHYYEN